MWLLVFGLCIFKTYFSRFIGIWLFSMDEGNGIGPIPGKVGSFHAALRETCSHMPGFWLYKL